MQLRDRREQFRKYFVVLIHCNASWSLIIPPETDLKRPRYGRGYAPTMDKSLENKKPKTESQRWSPRGQILKSLALASKVKSLALALKPQVLENCPVLGSRTAVFFELFKFCGALEKFFCGDRLKNFCEDLFFWRAFVLVSLVLGLGLEHSCPWPRECLSSERLSLALASDFFVSLALASSLVSSTPPLLNRAHPTA